MRWYWMLPAVLLLLLGACAPAYEWHGTTYQDPETAPRLNLSRVDGEAFELADREGELVLLYFGYTHCPDVCPATLADLKWLQEQLGPEEAEALTVAFVSVDPERDTPEAIRTYLTKFSDDFIGLHGSKEALAAAQAGYGVYSAKDSEESNYTVTHTSRVFLIDPQGRLRANYTFDTPREDLLADVRHVLASST